MSSTPSKVLSVLVLTEDSGQDADMTVQALVKEMLKLLVRGVRTHRIALLPLDDSQARRAMEGNIWKSTHPLDEPARRQLIRSIATELLKPAGFVLYHIDGDRPWSERESSENTHKFHEVMMPRLEAALRSHLQKHGSENELPERMKRLRLLVPFYSIEAWLYQNTREARQLCECGQCHLELTKWEQARASLDEIVKPKEELCFRDKHNAHLARTHFPAQETFEAQASFFHTVMELLDCKALTEALERTLPPEGAASSG